MNKKQHTQEELEASIDAQEEIAIISGKTCIGCKHSYLQVHGSARTELRCDFSDNTSSVCPHYAEREIEVIGRRGDHTFTVAEPAPMELKQVTGCTAFSLTVNGKEEIDLTPKERKEAWKKLCLWLAEKDGDGLNNLMQHVLESYGEYQSLSNEPCECCGDWVDSYTLTID